MASVSSGLGRNGPWLQNRWLRVESRQDDASISPVALAGAFRPTERALAYVEPVGAPAIHFERAEYDVRAHHDALGPGRTLTLVSRLPRRGVTLRRDVILYDAHPYCVTRVGITNDSGEPLPIAALHAFTTPSDGRGKLRVAASNDDLRIYRNGWQSWSPTMSFGGTQRDVRSARPVLSPEDPQPEAGRFASDEVGVLYDPTQRTSLLAGCVTAHGFVVQILIDAPGRVIDARCLADGVSVQPGQTLWSEYVSIDVCGSPNEQLERYGDALGMLMSARVPRTTPSGWCSWYYFFTEVTEEDVLRNLRFLEQHRRELPIDTVQIDDGYQADIGDWLTVNEKFPRGMAWLAGEIKRGGYVPGIWLAPFLLAETSRTFAEHPDWVIRDDRGAAVLATNNWQRRNYGLDGSRPEAQKWVTDLFREVCDVWGYDYVKIDFLFGAALAGRRADPNTTRVEAYRAALDAVRAGVGEGRFILGCGAPIAPSVGIFDGNRIGPDVAPFWRFLTTEERARPMPRARTPDDNLSAETAIRNTLNRSWMHRRVWANDPDCLLVRTDRTKLTLDETQTLATVIGLSGGMMLSSDDLPRLQAERLALLSMSVPPLPGAAIPVDLLDRDMPERYETSFDRPFDPLRLVALFNFEDEARDLMMDLPDGRWHAFELWSERYLGVLESHLELPLVSPHACRLLALRPVRNVPSLIATTAHIGCGALDVTDATFDERDGSLTFDLLAVGRRDQKIFFSTASRRPTRAQFGGADVPIAGNGDVRSVSLAVDAPAKLEIQFAN